VPAEAGDGLQGFREAKARLALAPRDKDLLYACCAAAGESGELEMLSLIEERLRQYPPGEKIRLHDLHLRVLLREKRARMAAGLATANTSDPADLEFRFCRDDLRQLIQESVTVLSRDGHYFPAAVLLAEASVCLGAYVDAEHAYSQLRAGRGGHISMVTSFDPDFHAALPDLANQAAARLPPTLVTRAPPAEARRIVFTAGDFGFFEAFGWQLVDTFARHDRSGVCLSLHVFDMLPQEKAELIRRLEAYPNLVWCLSGEWTGLRGGDRAAARGYYHAMRFIRLWQLLTETAADVWMVDMDTIFNADPARLFAVLPGYDLALFLSPARFEPRNKVNASASGLSNTPAARNYLRNVSGYLGYYHQAGQLLWGIDQIALFTVLVMRGAAAPMRVTGVPEWVTGGARRADQVLWAAKGP
jgi:hypothetical protein